PTRAQRRNPVSFTHGDRAENPPVGPSPPTRGGAIEPPGRRTVGRRQTCGERDAPEAGSRFATESERNGVASPRFFWAADHPADPALLRCIPDVFPKSP